MNERRTSGIATVMFTDVEASTDITTRLGDDAAAALFGAHDRIVRAHVAEFDGRDVRSTGDGFLVAFDSTRPFAIAAALRSRAFQSVTGCTRSARLAADRRGRRGRDDRWP